MSRTGVEINQVRLNSTTDITDNCLLDYDGKLRATMSRTNYWDDLADIADNEVVLGKSIKGIILTLIDSIHALRLENKQLQTMFGLIQPDSLDCAELPMR